MLRKFHDHDRELGERVNDVARQGDNICIFTGEEATLRDAKDEGDENDVAMRADRLS